VVVARLGLAARCVARTNGTHATHGTYGVPAAYTTQNMLATIEAVLAVDHEDIS
jgi:hypothetical protein